MGKLDLSEKRICLVQGRLFEETAARGMDSADFDTMCTAYMGFHTLSPEMAIDRLIEAYESHK